MLVKIISVMLENTYTMDDLVNRMGLLRKYYDKKLFVDESVTIREILEEETDEDTLVVLEHWNEQFIKTALQPVMVFEALDTVMEDVSGMPAVTVYVPVRFLPKQVEQLGTWFRENVQPNILLNMRIDPRTTGGCSFIWKDVFYDFSLRYFIEKERAGIEKALDAYMYAN